MSTPVALRSLTDDEWIMFEETMSAKRWVAIMMPTGVWVCEHRPSQKLIGGPYGSLHELALDIIYYNPKSTSKTDAQTD